LCGLRNGLFWAFCDTAAWWAQESRDDPADKRNKEANKLLHKIASSAWDIDDAILTAYIELREDDDDEYAFYELLNTIGFK
jgi:hypothetical protein